MLSFCYGAPLGTLQQAPNTRLCARFDLTDSYIYCGGVWNPPLRPPQSHWTTMNGSPLSVENTAAAWMRHKTPLCTFLSPLWRGPYQLTSVWSGMQLLSKKRKKKERLTWKPLGPAIPLHLASSCCWQYTTCVWSHTTSLCAWQWPHLRWCRYNITVQLSQGNATTLAARATHSMPQK